MAIDPTLTLSGLETTSEGIDGVLLKWTNDGDGCLTYAARNTVEVHRATTNNRSQATKINETEGNTYVDQGFSTRQTFYYWVRAKNKSGQVGPWEPSGSTNGIPGKPTTQDPGGVRNDLNVEDGATEGADFNINLLNIPNRITDNATIGLNITDSYLGYFNGSSWRVFIRNNGDFQLEGNSTNFLAWDASAGVLDIRGELNADDINAGTIDANRITAAERLRVGNIISPIPGSIATEFGIDAGGLINTSTKFSISGATLADMNANGDFEIAEGAAIMSPSGLTKLQVLEVFAGTTLKGNTTFDNDATFIGTATFNDATFSGTATFDGAVSGITAADVGALSDGFGNWGMSPSRLQWNGNFILEINNNQLIINTAGDINGSTAGTKVEGNLEVEGQFSKGSGSFVIRHPQPDKQGKELAHSFVETDSCGDNVYRRRVTATQHDEVVEITLPDYWPWLNTDPQAWAEPTELSFARCAAKVSDCLTKVRVRCEEPGTYDVLIMATRKDEVAVNNWKGVERDATRE